jgi:hypothetical protein
VKKNLFLVYILFLFIVEANFLLASTPEAAKISFKENKGQVYDQFYRSRPDVLFSGETDALVFHLKKDGISYQFSKVEAWKDPKIEVLNRSNSIRQPKVPETISIYRLDLHWLNTKPDPAITTDKELSGSENFYNESCPNGAKNVKSYSGIIYKNIYEGIDLHYYEVDGVLKYDYLLKTNSNHENIRIKIEGAEQISVDKKGRLLIKTPFGIITEGSPVVKQNNKLLEASWVINNNVVSYEIKNIDKNLPLIIDPSVRAWGTFYGGSGHDYSEGSCVDGSGNVYMSGYSYSNGGTLIATSGSHQSTFGGASDAFLAKFNSGGLRLWATYYGGSGGEMGYGCACDNSGNIYMAGYTSTNTSTVIASPGSHQPTFSGTSASFLAKFDPNGIRLWGTYYGGLSGNEQGVGCATDASGNVFMCGTTGSNSLIATPGSHQSLIANSLINDAYLVKFDANGTRLWATYYGDKNFDGARSCATDASGNVYMTGSTEYTTPSSAIATSASQQPVHGGAFSNDYNAFLVKFNSSGVRQWGTYYGVAGVNEGFCCTVDPSGYVYLTGYVQGIPSGTIIATPGSHQPTYGGGGCDAFLAKFDSNGIRQWGTYYGGPTGDQGLGCTTDNSGYILISGQTQNSTGIVTPGAYQTSFANTTGGNNAFLSVFSNSGALINGTYYGDIYECVGKSCAIDGTGIYLAGWTGTGSGTTPTVIATPGSNQPFPGGGSIVFDGYLVKFGLSIVTNLEQKKENSFNSPIYPNPTIGEFILQTNDGQIIEIYNSIGQLILKDEINSPKMKIDFNKEPAGIYFIRIFKEDQSVYFSKLIKE